MSKWTRVKTAVLAATAFVAAFQLGGCGLGIGSGVNLERIQQLVLIANLFD